MPIRPGTSPRFSASRPGAYVIHIIFYVSQDPSEKWTYVSWQCFFHFSLSEVEVNVFSAPCHTSCLTLDWVHFTRWVFVWRKRRTDQSLDCWALCPWRVITPELKLHFSGKNLDPLRLSKDTWTDSGYRHIADCCLFVWLAECFNVNLTIPNFNTDSQQSLEYPAVCLWKVTGPKSNLCISVKNQEPWRLSKKSFSRSLLQCFPLKLCIICWRFHC